MTIIQINSSQEFQLQISKPPQPNIYILFYASLVNGKSWCPDCVAIDSLLEPLKALKNLVILQVFVGEREEWRSPLNFYKNSSFKVTRLPTLVEVESGKRWIEDEITAKVFESIQK